MAGTVAVRLACRRVVSVATFLAEEPTRVGRGEWYARPVVPARHAARLVLALGAVWMTQASGQELARPRFEPAAFEAHVRFLASDPLEGRGIGTRGGELAVAYIESVFRTAGLRPGFDGSFRQPVEMTAYRSDPAAQVVAEVGRVRARLRQGEDIAMISYALEDTRVFSELVFVGYGISAPEHEWDDYAGADVRGRLLLALVNEPGRDDPRRFGGRALTLHGRWNEKLAVAARHGAAGLLLIHTEADAGYGWQIPAGSMTREKFTRRDETPLPLAGWIAEPAARRLLLAAGLRLEELREAAERPGFAPRTVPIRLAVQARRSTRAVVGHNVVGILPGTRPGTVVLSAHHDHLGIGPAVGGDRIYNGAVDNGTALGLLLTLAQGLAAAPATSRPTLVFAAVDAEEEGLLGSTHYTRHPAVPLADTLAAINFEMTNPWGRTRDLMAIGGELSELGEMVARVAARHGLSLTPDPLPEQGFFFRSDQLAFARAGVPAIWLDGGLDHEGRPPGWGAARRERYRVEAYHRPGDEVGDDWDWCGLQQLAEITVELIDEIAAAGEVRWVAGSGYGRPTPPDTPAPAPAGNRPPR